MDIARKTTDIEYTIEYLTTDDVPAVIAFLKSSFYKYEPLNQYLNLNNDEMLAKAHRSSTVISDDCSFKAVRSNGELIGIALNRYLDKSSHQSTPAFAQLNHHQKFNKIDIIGHLLDYIHDECKLFEMYPKCDRMLINELISIRPAYHGMGIGQRLLQRSIDYQRECGVKLLKIECTNRFTARMCARMNCEMVYTLRYADYMVDGVYPFKPDPPNDVVEIFISVLRDDDVAA